MIEYDKEGLVDKLVVTICNHFNSKFADQPDARTARETLKEMTDTVTLVTAALMPGFEDDPVEYIRLGRAGSSQALQGLLKTVMTPDSKAWSPPS